MQLSEVTKTIINVCTLIVAVGSATASAFASPSYPPSVGLTVSLIVSVAGAVLHYLTPNTTSDPIRAATRSVVYVPAHSGVKVRD